jgi:hypothetical protein
VSSAQARAALQRHGAEVLLERPLRRSFDITLDPARRDSLAAEDGVKRVGRYPPPKRTYNDGSTAWTNTDALQSAGITGRGVVVSLWDGGEVDAQHQDLAGRVTFGEVPRTNTFSDHSTHVAGTMAGNGTADATLTGHASQADEIVSYDFFDDVPTEMLGAITTHDIVLANNSWGYRTGWDFDPNVGWVFFNNQGNFGSYMFDAPDLDQLVREQGLILVFAAGNDRNDPTGGQQTANQPADWDQGTGNNGFDTMSPVAGAKNVIAVGAVADPGGGIAAFTNWGPMDDGRTKPDVVAPGVNIVSADGGTTAGYRNSSGTSMAAPAVSGIAALLIQSYREEYFGDFNSTEVPLPSTVKALLIHSAQELGNPGPDFQFGWGGADAEAANELIANRMVLEEELQNTGDEHVFMTEVPAGEQSVRATLVWDDVPGQTLVNDLDLTVTAPDGTVYLPWALNPNPGNWTNPATTAVDRTNNVEQVVVNNPMAGRWETTVRAFRIDPTGTPPEQTYSLIRTFIAPQGFSNCIDFEDLVVGTTYTYGDMFSSGGVPISVQMFTFANNQQTTGTGALVDNQLRAGGSGNDLNSNNVNLDFAFGGPVNGLNLRFGEFGGNLNLEINGDFRNFANFSDINGQTIGGVSVSVVNGLGNDQGTLSLSGTINGFVVGGQELWIDDVCPGPSPPNGDGGQALGLSLHAGIAVPFGSLNNTNDLGPTVSVDLVRRFTPQVFADLRIGYSLFPGSGSASDFDVVNLSANLKVIPVLNTPWVFLNGGFGLYYLDTSNWETGYNLGAGLGVSTSSNLDLELTANYHATFAGSPTVRFGKLQLGLIFWLP